MKRIAINGFGRIGRCLLRALFENSYQNLDLVAINSPADSNIIAHLLKYDSIHGKFNAQVQLINDNLIINGKTIKIFHEKSIEKIPWGNLSIDLVLESSGKFNEKGLALKHLKVGAKKVIISAPCSDADATIVYGVNHQLLNRNNSFEIISAGSCTTNAVAPITKIINDNLGIEAGFMTTIHSYTNDQNIVDGSHKDLRRGRAALLSMIPTSTGVAKVIDLVIPELKGKLGGAAVRVPTPNVSLIDLSFVTNSVCNVEVINDLMKCAVENSMQNILSIAESQMVSVDFNHNACSAIFDPFETQVVQEKLGRIVAWYDNEWGFSCRVLDIANIWK